MRVLFISAEVAPYSKTGGLGDVVGALPKALVKLGITPTIVTPRYRGIDPQRFSLARRLHPFTTQIGSQSYNFTLYEGHLPGAPEVRVYFIDHPFYDRAGIYNENGQDYSDNA